MKWVRFEHGGKTGLAVEQSGELRGLLAGDAGWSGDLDQLLRAGPDAMAAAAARLAGGRAFDPAAIRYLPPLARPAKIICIGLNYADHTDESPYEQPDYPTVFARFASGFVGHGQPLIRPRVSTQFDYEGEMVAVIGTAARHVDAAQALDHVAGYSIFNDGSIRDYQFKSPQWTMGKNFDGTGGFGPAFVDAADLPPGATGLHIETRLNGEVVQTSNTASMIHDVAHLVAILSEAFVLEPGDIIVTGTPAGVGFARKPPLFMQNGDVCEVEIDGIGTLANPIRDGD